MQWNCPHCGVSLAVSDNALGSGWSFSRCYKCGGFALVRKTEINVIKVDKAPPGERVILPEASGNGTTALMNDTATAMLAKHLNNKTQSEKSVSTKPSLTPPPFNGPENRNIENNKTSEIKNDEARNLNHFPSDMLYPVDLQPKTLGNEILSKRLPEPLPEMAPKRKKLKILPIGIATAGVITLLSGFYLYIQGQTLWQKTKETHLATRSAEQRSLTSKADQTTASLGHAELEERSIDRPNDRILGTPSDRIPASILTTKPAAQIVAVSNSNLLNHPVADQIPAQNSVLITDQVQRSAMAPLTPSQAQEPSPNLMHSMFVKVRGKKVNLHSGPGMSYPMVGLAYPEIQYQVADWNDRWFKLTPKTGATPVTVGWVRNDLVEVSTNASPSRITAPKLNSLR